MTETDVSKITRVQLVELLEDMDETPAMANRLHAYLSKFFNWCWDRGYVDPSPMAGLKKRFKEKARKRHLSADEIKQLWTACLELGYPLGDWCRFTLATGQRLGECRNLSRDDLHNGVWLVEGGEKPITQGGKFYAELYGAVKIETDWRPHDLRRTFQTLASEELDIEPYLLGAICNQISVAKPGVSSVYNQAKWMKPKEEALKAWNDYLKEIVEGN